MKDIQTIISEMTLEEKAALMCDQCMDDDTN